MTYQLLDAGDFQKLEQIGTQRIVRPAAQAIWKKTLDKEAWSAVSASYERFADGKGTWHRHGQADAGWLVELAGVRLRLKLTSFGHLGLFAEQARNWQELRTLCQELKKQRPVSVLNLFAYTGAASIACAQGGAEITHVDASKGTVDWARQNFEANGLGQHKVRFLVDDAAAFAAREGRRGKKYDGVILDPPTYGRGPDKQVWKIEQHLLPLLDQVKSLVADGGFILLSGHSPGHTPLVINNLLQQLWPGARIETREMGILDAQGTMLPSGVAGLAQV